MDQHWCTGGRKQAKTPDPCRERAPMPVSVSIIQTWLSRTHGATWEKTRRRVSDLTRPLSSRTKHTGCTPSWGRRTLLTCRQATSPDAVPPVPEETPQRVRVGRWTLHDDTEALIGVFHRTRAVPGTHADVFQMETDRHGICIHQAHTAHGAAPCQDPPLPRAPLSSVSR